MRSATPLRLAILGNAGFSATCGLFALYVPEMVGGWLGLSAPLVLRFLGIGLLAFAAGLLYFATRRRPATWVALLISAADLMWVVGSIVLVLVAGDLFSPLGIEVILGVALLVLLFCVAQVWAAGRAHKIGEGDTYRHCIVVESRANAADLWQVVGDIGEIKHYMPLLRSSRLLDGKTPGVGAVRACEARTGERWSEECTSYIPGKSFTVRFRVEEPGFPMPVKAMVGGWEVTPRGEGSQVMVWWELMPRRKWLSPVFLPLFGLQMDRNFADIVRRMTAAACGKQEVPQGRRKSPVLSRVLPNFC